MPGTATSLEFSKSLDMRRAEQTPFSFFLRDPSDNSIEGIIGPATDDMVAEVATAKTCSGYVKATRWASSPRARESLQGKI